MIAEFIIHAQPTGKARPRVTSRGTYTPEKTKAYEKLVKQEFKTQCPGVYFSDNQIAVYIKAYHKIPKSTRQSKRDQMLNGFIRPKVKPDLDNVAKAICDALNGVAYHDDVQIVTLSVEKHYTSIEPYVSVCIADFN